MLEVQRLNCACSITNQIFLSVIFHCRHSRYISLTYPSLYCRVIWHQHMLFEYERPLSHVFRNYYCTIHALFVPKRTCLFPSQTSALPIVRLSDDGRFTRSTRPFMTPLCIIFFIRVQCYASRDSNCVHLFTPVCLSIPTSILTVSQATLTHHNPHCVRLQLHTYRYHRSALYNTYIHLYKHKHALIHCNAISNDTNQSALPNSITCEGCFSANFSYFSVHNPVA